MTCADCINKDACSSDGKTKFSNEQRVEERCRLFKSTHTYSVVVKCSMCKFCSKNTGFPDAPPWCNHAHPVLSYADLPHNWGCPLGERMGT